MIRLQTLGGLSLYGDDGRPLAGAAAQRRILALLALAAASGEKGWTRDKIVGVMWPDSSPRRARHSLTQTMYAARKALGCDDLFQGAEDVRLNPERISSDVAEFESAFRAGDDSRAAELYRGPFLDGFYLSASEFDWWLNHQRARLEDEAVVALQRLVTVAEEAEDWERAAGHLRRLVRIRPSDSVVVVRLMKTLAAAGDRAAAIQHAVSHERLLREQYDLEPEAEVLSLAGELREAQASAAAMVSPEHASEAELRVEASAEAAGAPEWLVAAGVDGPSAPSRRRAGAQAAVRGRGRRRLRSWWASARSTRTWWTAAGAVVLVTGTVLALWVLRPRSKPSGQRTLDQGVVVAPFRVAGADPALAYLRDGMVDMLSTRLADDTAARSVDPGAVLAAWREAGVTRSAELPRDSIIRLAARLGADRVVVGSVVGTPGRMVVIGAVLVVPSGRVAGQTTVEGTADRLSDLVDQLAARLLLVQAGESDRLADHMSRSLPALRAYLAGVAADARGDHAVATRAYARALQSDSTFALAALHLGIAAGRLNDYEVERQALHRAWRFRKGLSDRDESELMAMLGPRYPAPSTAGQALAAWESAARLAPNREEVWLGLARRIRIDGATAGLGNLRERTLSALRRAVTLDRNEAAARVLLARMAGPEAARPQPQGADTSLLPLGLFFRWWSAADRSDVTVLAALADSLPDAGPANLREIAAASAFEALRPADGARALEILAGRATDADQALGVLIAQHSLALQRGRPGSALGITRDIGRLGPTGRPHLRLRVLDAVFGQGDTTAAAEAALELQRTATSDLPNASADACALAQWQLAQFDTAGARGTLGILRAAPPDATPPAVGAPAPACAALVDAALRVMMNRSDGRAALDRIDALVLTSVGAGDVAAYAPIVISRLYRRLNAPAQALAAIRRRPDLASVWPRYLATELREEGDLARELGDLAGAAMAYRQYLSLRHDPEPALEPEVRAVRALARSLAPG